MAGLEELPAINYELLHCRYMELSDVGMAMSLQ
jgi:hypothetical protein